MSVSPPSPLRSRRWRGLAAATLVVWCVMTTVLVLVPDLLEEWVGLEVGRIVGWAVAGAIWMATIEPAWRARVGPFWRFTLQLILWITAALVAISISEMTTVRVIG